MTRSSLQRTLRRSYWLLGLVLVFSLIAKLADHIPGIAGTPLESLAKDLYEYLKDMALVFVTVVAAYVASVFQKRHRFIEALREEWRDIIKAKSALFTYTQLDRPTQEQYLQAFCAISETIDNMRSVYKNVGETGRLVGYYPYEPLHDMRRALQNLDPKKNSTTTEEQRTVVRHAILESWYALRERFLEELDLEAPENPLLIPRSRRTKAQGASRRGSSRLAAQRKHRPIHSETDPSETGAAAQAEPEPIAPRPIAAAQA